MTLDIRSSGTLHAQLYGLPLPTFSLLLVVTSHLVLEVFTRNSLPSNVHSYETLTTFRRHLIFSTQPLQLPSNPSQCLWFVHNHGALFTYLLTYLLTYFYALNEPVYLVTMEIKNIKLVECLQIFNSFYPDTHTHCATHSTTVLTTMFHDFNKSHSTTGLTAILHVFSKSPHTYSIRSTALKTIFHIFNKSRTHRHNCINNCLPRLSQNKTNKNLNLMRQTEPT